MTWVYLSCTLTSAKNVNSRRVSTLWFVPSEHSDGDVTFLCVSVGQYHVLIVLRWVLVRHVIEVAPVVSVPVFVELASIGVVSHGVQSQRVRIDMNIPAGQHSQVTTSH